MVWLIHKFDHYKGLLFFIVTGFLHTAASPVLQERQEDKRECDLSFSDVAFSVWYLRLSIYGQYFFFLNLALNLSSFCSLLCSFTSLPPHFRVKVLLLVKHNSPESSTNKAWFWKFSKCLSVYPWFIRCVQEKHFH